MIEKFKKTSGQEAEYLMKVDGFQVDNSAKSGAYGKSPLFPYSIKYPPSPRLWRTGNSGSENERIMNTPRPAQLPDNKQI